MDKINDQFKIKINDKFEYLTVIEEVDKKEGYCTYYWKCLCDCGSERIVSGRYLINGKIKSCVNCTRITARKNIVYKISDIVGQRSGNLVFVSYQGGSRWLCQCDCGRTTIISTSGNRTTRSCGNCKSIVGKKYGRLLVLEYTPKTKCLCRCDCGIEKEIDRNALKDGSIKSCGCLAKERTSNIQINQRFEKLVCIERVENDANNNIVWSCQCDCGNTTRVKASNLLSGSTKACSAKCYRKTKVPEGVLGNTFGLLTPYKYSGNQKWLCRCSCGSEVTRQTRDLLDGKTISCGCSRINRNNTEIQRQCGSCKKIKPLTKEYFGKHKQDKQGFRNDCHSCRHDKRVNELWLNSRLSSYISGDRKRKREHNIDLQFLKVFLKDGTKCIYCGYSGKLGLDRINNSLGHLKDNVLPCCYDCNRIRSNRFSVEQMKKFIGPAIKKARKEE